MFKNGLTDYPKLQLHQQYLSRTLEHVTQYYLDIEIVAFFSLHCG